MTPRPVTHATLTHPLITGRFAEGATYNIWRPHGTRDFLLILTLGGAGRFGTTSGEVRVASGDLVIVRPGTPHDYATARDANRWELVWAHFLPRPHWQEWLAGLPQAAPGIGRVSLGTNTEARQSVEAALSAMNGYATEGLLRATDFAMNALETALLHVDAANPEAANRAHFDARVLRVMERLRGELLSEPLSLTGLAASVHLSPSRLSHLFKAQTGRTPAQFHEDERLLRACDLLRFTNRSVGAIAQEVGFASPFYFTLRFKKHAGQSPREFRRADTHEP